VRQIAQQIEKLDPSSGTRREELERLMMQLRESGAPAVPTLQRFLNSSDYWVSDTAAFALYQMEPRPEMVGGLVRAIVRAQGYPLGAISALSRERRAALPEIARALDRSDARAKRHFCDAMRWMWDRECVPILLRLMRDPDEEVRASAYGTFRETFLMRAEDDKRNDGLREMARWEAEQVAPIPRVVVRIDKDGKAHEEHATEWDKMELDLATYGIFRQLLEELCDAAFPFDPHESPNTPKNAEALRRIEKWYRTDELPDLSESPRP
jgi:hypothetical protein